MAPQAAPPGHLLRHDHSACLICCADRSFRTSELTGIVCMTLGAVLSFDSFSYALVFPAAYLTLAILEGNCITPWVMGRSLALNPVLVLLSLTFWGWMWGIAGVILAVPILAAFKIFALTLSHWSRWLNFSANTVVQTFNVQLEVPGGRVELPTKGL